MEIQINFITFFSITYLNDSVNLYCMTEIGNITIAGKEYGLFDEPKHGVVREIKKMQEDISITFLKKHLSEIKNLNVNINEALTKIFQDDPSEMVAFNDVTKEFNALATISFATNTIWTSKKLENLTEKEFKETLKKCKEILGGDFTVFLTD